jgi:hypothetical protein
MRERILSEETKARISEAKKGKNNPWFGKTRSEETKASARGARETQPRLPKGGPLNLVKLMVQL